ncbi:MAG: hypothetical protein ACOYKD_06720 [Anaerolineaceae bacterium]|jgi:hypothetical protein
MMGKTNISLIIICLLIIGACKPKDNIINEKPPISGNYCLEPIVKGIYPTGEESWKWQDYYKEDPNEVLDPAGWILFSKIPIEKASETELLFSRSSTDGNELFFTTMYDYKKELIVFDVSTRSFDTLLTTTHFHEFIMDFGKNIWVYGQNEDLNQKSSGYTLERFDENTNLLLPVQDKEDLFSDSQYLTIAPGKEPYFWILSVKDGWRVQSRRVYLYNTSNDKIEYEKDTKYYSIVADRENNLIMEDADGISRLDWETGNEIARELDSGSTGIFESYLGESIITENNLIVVSDRGIFNNDRYLSGNSKFIRSPIFITSLKYNGYTPLDWQRPAIQAMTPDGRFWYRSTRGLTWFQPETGQWCMFTTAHSSIIKDDAGNLWLIYNNALYMLPAEKTKAYD